MDLLLSYYSSNTEEAISALKQFTDGDLYRIYTFAEDEGVVDKISAAEKTIAAILAENKVESNRLRLIPATQRARILRAIKEKTDVSNREIATILNISKDMVNRA